MSAGRRPQRFDVQAEIKRVILDRGLEAGGPVPTETELMAELGVGRSSVREALKGLQARGIVEVRHGLGTFVAQPNMAALVDGLVFHGLQASARDDLTVLSELVDVRDILETALVRQVAVNPDPAIVEALERSVTAMEDAAKDGRPFEAADRRFHEQLYAGLGNSVVRQLVGAFWDVLAAVRPQLSDGATDALTDAGAHRRILDRVRDGDQDGASRAMADHFRATHLWIQGRRTDDV